MNEDPNTKNPPNLRTHPPNPTMVGAGPGITRRRKQEEKGRSRPCDSEDTSTHDRSIFGAAGLEKDAPRPGRSAAPQIRSAKWWVRTTSLARTAPSGAHGSRRAAGPSSCGDRPAPARQRSRGCSPPRSKLHFDQLSAVFTGVADLKKTFRGAAPAPPRGTGHASFHRRDSPLQPQPAGPVLPVMEGLGTIIAVGATTENQSFELENGAPLSRAQGSGPPPSDDEDSKSCCRAEES